MEHGLTRRFDVESASKTKVERQEVYDHLGPSQVKVKEEKHIKEQQNLLFCLNSAAKISSSNKHLPKLQPSLPLVVTTIFLVQLAMADIL